VTRHRRRAQLIGLSLAPIINCPGEKWSGVSNA
jgi:hypothetical protein